MKPASDDNSLGWGLGIARLHTRARVWRELSGCEHPFNTAFEPLPCRSHAPSLSSALTISQIVRRKEVMWTGMKYAVTDEVDVIAGYYHYIQNSYFSTATGAPAPCFGSQHSQSAGTFAAVDWRFAALKGAVRIGALEVNQQLG